MVGSVGGLKGKIEMQILFTEAEQDYFNRVRTLRDERKREFLQLDNICRGFIGLVAQSRVPAGSVCRLLADGTGMDVTPPLETPETRGT